MSDYMVDVAAMRGKLHIQGHTCWVEDAHGNVIPNHPHMRLLQRQREIERTRQRFATLKQRVVDHYRNLP